MSTLATAIAETLIDHGIRQAFGVVGNGNILPVAMLTAGGMQYVSARHEGGAIAMADSYYRATGEVALCSTTYGPGFTNIATGLAEAVKHRSGILALCGDQPAAGRRRIDIDQQAFAVALDATVVRVTDPATARAQAAHALQLARTASTPVVLFLPHDLLTVDVPEQTAIATVERYARPVASRETIEAALDAIAGARRPLMLAGLGAWRSGARKVITDLADRLGALLTTTVMAGGMFSESAWSLGICGGFASPQAAAIIGDADVVIALGASLNNWTLHGGKIIDPRATVIHVDVRDQPSGGRADLVITGDASAVAAALLDGVNARGQAVSPWRAEVANDLKHIGWKHHSYDDASTADRIDPRTLSRTLGEFLPDERTIVTDGGHFVGWPFMYLPAPDPNGVIFTGASFQSIGLGFGGAVGAAVGRKDRTTVVALGDGGALMGLADLETLIRTADSALVVIYDDAAYGFEVHVYGSQIADGIAAFSETDFAGVARSLGAAAVTVRTVEDLAAARTWCAEGCRGTLVLDCKVTRNVVASFLAESGSISTGMSSPRVTVPGQRRHSGLPRGGSSTADRTRH